MHTSRNLGRLIRVALVLLALVVGVGTATIGAAPTPAQAGGPYIVVCFPVYWHGIIIGWECHRIPIPVEMDICPRCPDWALSFDHLVNPADPRYVRDILDGLDLLGQAALNPRQADQLRAAAQLEFIAAAGRVGDPEIQPGEVGIVDWQRNVIEPEPDPWLVAADTDLADGLRLMQRGLREPDPSPWLDAAMDQFEEAYQEIARQQPVGK
jgi:hypothetical protein